MIHTVSTHRLRILALAAAPLLAMGVITGSAPASAVTAGSPRPHPVPGGSRVNAARLPLTFQPNQGQAGAGVRYLGQAPGVTALFTSTGITLDLTRGAPGRGTHARTPGTDARLTLAFRGASRQTRVTGSGRQPGSVSYFLGNNPARWHADVPTFARVVYHQLWPGIDATFTAGDGTLRYWFTLAPRARPSDIRLAYAGARRLAVDRSGALAITTAAGILHDLPPATTQTRAGHQIQIPSRYTLTGGTSFGFTLASHTPGDGLTIDPGLEYSTFLGGNVADSAFSIDADAAGDLYVFGQTASPDFPTTPGAYQRRMTAKTGGVFFVTKLNPTGTGLIYSTFVGGTSFQGVANGVVDSSGDAYVTGQTGSLDFPVTAGAYRTTPFAAQTQSVVFKLNPAGSRLLYSTYLAPDLISAGLGRQIGLAPNGSVIVIGTTDVDYAPTTPGAFQVNYPGGYPAGYVARLNRAGSGLIYASYLGAPVSNQNTNMFGAPSCSPEGLAVDTYGAAYVAASCGTRFPTTPGAYQTAGTGANDGLLMKIAPTGTRLDYATYYGTLHHSTDIIRPDAVAVDSSGDAYLVADTPAGDIPATRGASASDCINGGGSSGYCTAVAEINPTGTGLIYSTYFGGYDANGDYDGPDSVAVDTSGHAYVTGTAGAKDIPTTAGAYSRTPGNFTFPFYLAVFGKGNLLYASYFGGTSQRCLPGTIPVCGVAGGMTVAPEAGSGSVYLGGTTASTEFPVTPGTFQTTYPGGVNVGWAAKLGLPSLTPGG